MSARAAGALIAVGLIAGLSACGGGGERQDENEPEGEFPVDVATAKFENRQRLAGTTDLELEVKNVGEQPVPDLAVTVCIDDCDADNSFSVRLEQRGLANPNRPAWILENNYPKVLKPGDERAELDELPSAGAEAAHTNTFSFGELRPGDSRDMVWRVTPVRAGTFTVNWQLAAGLEGKAKAVTADGNPVRGKFVVTVSDKPPNASVDDQGKVVVQGE